jgi:2-polyprenyl-3-methyl-5-hydroxy-6-metoxy-1,4-benzoquinol methylase
MFFPKLNDRYNGPELMDNSETDSKKLDKTLDEFHIVNKLLSKSRYVLLKYIFEDVIRKNSNQITLLDIGSGGGDIDRWFVEHARSVGVTATVVGIDHDQRCIDYASKKSASFHEISFLKMDVSDLEKIDNKYDYIFANHFLHHLDSSKIPQLLYNVKNTAQRGFLINDLLRSKISYLFFYLLFPLFSHRSFTWRDGLMSIRKGFTCKEMADFARIAAVYEYVKIFTLVPGRIIVTNL